MSSSYDHGAKQPGGVFSSVARWSGLVGQAAGWVAGAITLMLAASVLLGIGLRTAGIDNSWTYDLAQFALVWLAFLGAAYTGFRGGHVTSGISLEHLLGRGAIVLMLIRFVVVAVFLAVFTYSGWGQFHSAWQFNEQTLDVAEWPVWIAKLALPVGGAAWLAGEIHKFAARLSGRLPDESPGH